MWTFCPIDEFKSCSSILSTKPKSCIISKTKFMKDWFLASASCTESLRHCLAIIFPEDVQEGSKI